MTYFLDELNKENEHWIDRFKRGKQCFDSSLVQYRLVEVAAISREQNRTDIFAVMEECKIEKIYRAGGKSHPLNSH